MSRSNLMITRTSFIVLIAAATLVGCSDDADDGRASNCELSLPPVGEFYDNLSDYCFFRGDPAAQTPSDGLVPYAVNTKLYSDHSSKYRFIALPEGEKIEFHETDRWQFPVGTTVVKTFYFPDDLRAPDGSRRLVETRLMVRQEDDWSTHTYLWNTEQTEAASFLVGKGIDVNYIDQDGESVDGKYRVPAKSDCRNCHASGDKTVLLGPRTRQLNRLNDYGEGPVNQLEYFAERGMFDGPIPAVDTLDHLIDPKDTSLPLDKRARTYLEGNCAHCHNSGGAARNSGLFLAIDVDTPITWGRCKTPIAAGRGAGDLYYDIVPGKPEESIMVYRMDSMEAGVKMPELPLTTIDRFGVDLISEWISQLPGDCPPTE